MCLQRWRKPGFWQVQLQVLKDVYLVMHGPDRRAVQLALALAVINQGMASNSIINYAPLLLQSVHGAGNNAVLWTSFITLAKVGLPRGRSDYLYWALAQTCARSDQARRGQACTAGVQVAFVIVQRVGR